MIEIKIKNKIMYKLSASFIYLFLFIIIIIFLNLIVTMGGKVSTLNVMNVSRTLLMFALHQ